MLSPSGIRSQTTTTPGVTIYRTKQEHRIGHQDIPFVAHEIVDSFLDVQDQVSLATAGRYPCQIAHYLTQRKMALSVDMPPVPRTSAEKRKMIDPAHMLRKEIDEILADPRLGALPQKALNSPAIRKLIYEGRITIHFAMTLNETARSALERPIIQDYIFANHITPFDVCELTPEVIQTLEMPLVKKYMFNGFFKLDDVMDLRVSQIVMLDSEVVQKYIDAGQLTKRALLRMTITEKFILEHRGIQEAIDAGELPVNAIIGIERNADKARFVSNCLFVKAVRLASSALTRETEIN